MKIHTLFFDNIQNTYWYPAVPFGTFVSITLGSVPEFLGTETLKNYIEEKKSSFDHLFIIVYDVNIVKFINKTFKNQYVMINHLYTKQNKKGSPWTPPE